MPDFHEVKQAKVLVVDDDEGVRTAVTWALEADGFEVTTVSDPVEGLEAAVQPNLDVALFDINMPNLSGIDLLRAVKQRNPALEVIMMTASTSPQIAIEAVRSGAYDYLTKPFESSDAVALVVGRACEHRQLIEKNKVLQEKVQKQANQLGGPEMVGLSPSMVALERLINSIAMTHATVLIQGESGTGKELVARAIHERSNRRDKPFVVINCSAIPENLLESELFGHEKGSFTGAIKDAKGVFEAADGGTLFLDEIGDMALSTQVRLLRAIQQGEIKPVGSSQVVNVDVRLVAATNVNLKQAIASGRFREDLYYRLNVIPIPIVPLRERAEDIPLLAHHFLKKLVVRHGKDLTGFTPEAMQALTRHAWPGNVRELENLVERMVILCQTRTVTKADLPIEVLGVRDPDEQVDNTSLAHLPYNQAKSLAARTFERRYLGAAGHSEFLPGQRTSLYRTGNRRGHWHRHQPVDHR